MKKWYKTTDSTPSVPPVGTGRDTLAAAKDCLRRHNGGVTPVANLAFAPRPVLLRVIAEQRAELERLRALLNP